MFRYKEFFLLSTYLLVFSVSDPGFFSSVFSHSVLRSRSQDLLAGQELSFIILTVFILFLIYKSFVIEHLKKFPESNVFIS